MLNQSHFPYVHTYMTNKGDSYLDLMVFFLGKYCTFTQLHLFKHFNYFGEYMLVHFLINLFLYQQSDKIQKKTNPKTHSDSKSVFPVFTLNRVTHLLTMWGNIISSYWWYEGTQCCKLYARASFVSSVCDPIIIQSFLYSHVDSSAVV